MASLLDKVKLLVKVSIHDKLDEALRKKDIGVLKEYIRQAEEAIDALNDSIAVILAGNQGFQDKVNFWNGEKDKHQKGVDALLREEYAKNKDLEAAKAAGSEKAASLEASLTETKTLLASAQSKVNHDKKMMETNATSAMEGGASVDGQRKQKMVLESNIDELKGKLEEVEAEIAKAKASETVVAAREKAEEVLGRGDNDVDSIVDNAKNRNRVAQNKLSEMDNTVDSQLEQRFHKEEVDGELAKRRKELGLE